MLLTRLTESDEYVKAREELRQAEVDLMREGEREAAMRRQLPEGPVVDDYAFFEGPARLDAGDEPVRTVRLTDQFSSPDRPLVVYYFMYGKAQTSPCPMCTLWIDGFNGLAHHLAQRADFVIAGAADVGRLRAWGRQRGWDRARLLGCGDSSFKFDLGSEDEEGNQDSTVSVFSLDTSGTPRHVYGGHPTMADDIRERGIDLLSPLWHILDLTPRGRGDGYASHAYGP